MEAGFYSPKFFMTSYNGDVSLEKNCDNEVVLKKPFLDIYGYWFLCNKETGELIKTNDYKSYRIDLTLKEPIYKEILDYIDIITEK
ncbi:hypothetical protein V6O07_10460, partial [Arthrospira platensis SPKY2]